MNHKTEGMKTEFLIIIIAVLWLKTLCSLTGKYSSHFFFYSTLSIMIYSQKRIISSEAANYLQPFERKKFDHIKRVRANLIVCTFYLCNFRDSATGTDVNFFIESITIRSGSLISGKRRFFSRRSTIPKLFYTTYVHASTSCNPCFMRWYYVLCGNFKARNVLYPLSLILR